MLFSATYDDQIMEFAQAIVPNPILIRLKREEESLDNIKQYYVICGSQEEKYNAIANIYGGITVGQVMIFCHVSVFIVIYQLNHLSINENSSSFFSYLCLSNIPQVRVVLK